MAKVFNDLLLKGVRSGKIPAREQDAKDWYRQKSKEYYGKKRIAEKKFFKDDPSRQTGNIQVGSMYMFFYDAKHKNTLPYYDRFPLIFPFAKTDNGFMGINLHYLPLAYRAQLMDGLYSITNNQKYDETTKLEINYKALKSVSKLSNFKPCVKRYLTSQTRSQFLYIYPSEWDIALFLPLERFSGARKTSVWKDSKRILQG